MAALATGIGGCTQSIVDPGVPPPTTPPDATVACGDVCGGPPGRDIDVDPIAFLGRGVDNFNDFFEPVEIVSWKNKIALCSGVRGLAIYRNDDPCCLSLEAAIRPDPTVRYPRCQHLAFRNDWAIVANRGDELSPRSFVTVINVADPLDARRLGVLDDGETSFEGLAVDGDIVYVAQHERGLGVVTLSSRGELTRIREVTAGLQNAWKPVVDGDRLYVADAQGGLVIFDIRDRRAPVLLGRAPTEGTLKAIAVRGDYVYGAAGTAGLEVFDVRDPVQPQRVRRLDTRGSAIGIAVDGDHLVLSDWNDVLLYRLTDPAQPTRVGHQKAYDDLGPSPLGRILDVTAKDGVIYMAEWAGVQAHRIVAGADAPDLQTDAVVEMPRASPGEPSNTGLTVRNLGQRDLNLTAVEVSEPFRVELFDTEIPAGGQVLASLTFDPTSDQPAQGSLTIRSNDPDEPITRVALRGNLPGLRTADEVPDLAFTTLDGRRTIRLSDFQGQPVLLAYFATF